MNDVIKILNEASQHRVAKVQKSARDAKEIWDSLKIKGDELAATKQEAEPLDPNSVVTPDDLLKVQSGFGNVADAKTLGYLRNRKSRSRPRKSHKNKLEEKRSKSKQLNSSKNNKNSEIMKEKILNMEQERINLMRQADLLKKRDNSFDNLMEKYIKDTPSKRPNKQPRESIMGKIKERASNLEKGKSIEVIESRRAREKRLDKERQNIENVEKEGGEEEDPGDDQNQDDHQNLGGVENIDEEQEDNGMFEQEEGFGGDQAFNKPAEVLGNNFLIIYR